MRSEVRIWFLPKKAFRHAVQQRRDILYSALSEEEAIKNRAAWITNYLLQKEVRQDLHLTEEDEKAIAGEKKSMLGALAKYADPERIPLEKGAWARAAVKKHAQQNER